MEADGKILAGIDNQGVITADAALESDLTGQPQRQVHSASGPGLAAQISELLAQPLGGKVNRSTSALSQEAYQTPVDQRNAAASETMCISDMQKDEMHKQIQSR